MTSPSTRRADDRDRGAAMVEFALILPVLVALIFGIISYGYMLSYRQGLSQGASEAARAAAIVPSGMPAAAKLAKATTALNDAMGSYGVSCAGGVLRHDGAASGSCSIQTSTACPQDSSRRCAVVTVTHAYRAHPLISSFPGLGITLPENLSYTAVVEVN
ncbi:TadE family protein [Aeromicrobium chenweiae]|nr:TadE family protein [Aeromicrobium chenweiae]